MVTRRADHEREQGARLGDNADRVWGWTGAVGMRRAARRVRLLLATAGIAHGTDALEVGCGTGLFLRATADAGAQVTGLDVSPDLLAIARQRTAGLQNVRLVSGDAEHLPFADASFDAVYGSSVLHHVDLARTLSEVFRVLRPGGRVAFAEPNALNPHIAFTFHAGPLRSVFGLTRDERAFSRFRAAQALIDAGFVGASVVPFGFLHPATPSALIGAIEVTELFLERVSVIREIAGSLLLRAVRPGVVY
jgi:SAM-dependent methyltransferase